MPSLELVGYLASALVLCTFYMKTMIPLRLVAIASNLAFITYGYVGDIAPVLILHCLLLPLNVIRLLQIRALIRKVKEAAHGDLSVEWLLPQMTRRILRKSEVLFRRDEKAGSMFVLLSGVVAIEEFGVIVPPGTLIGEIGVFSPAGVRTGTAVCLEEAEVGEIDNAKVQQLYYQNPVFGMYLVRLVIDRLLTDLKTVSAHLNGPS